ncbi:amino acid-binding ACT domain protein [Desulfatibacillum aliphaticivorans]|uniref:Amino acid-binding ACT domain protein n=1 Tax=Desulfatibacillum aliphaticivorans TaxID=218208 RepID=B8FEK3_DESAL|nr:ACT domain-containing protein [Desulfatibacillum aliphaticivorans]ACL03407.1 amino acid-binding ACT domain protein [Desulfatibacillum aliphaticivorans]
MFADQISVFLENKAGRLAEVTRTLAGASVNIRALSLADTSDFGILRLIVDDNEKAESALKEAGFTVRTTRVVAVEVSDKPGGLMSILEFLDSKQINVEYMYAFVRQRHDNAVMIFRFDNTDSAVEALTAEGFAVIKGDELYTM